MRVLDLGCGKGRPLIAQGVIHSDEVYGVDIKEQSLEIARCEYPDRHFYHASAYELPFPAQFFDRVVSNVALPYMDIPKALAEVRRVLTNEGDLWISVHGWQFTVSEARKAFPAIRALIGRARVFVRGIMFHFGYHVHAESFQTETAMRRELERAGFMDVQMSWPKVGRLVITATVKKSAKELAAA